MNVGRHQEKDTRRKVAWKIGLRETERLLKSQDRKGMEIKIDTVCC